MKPINTFIFCYLFLVGLSALAQSRVEYMAVLEDLEIEDMRDTFYQIKDHGFNSKAYWTDEMEKSFQRGFSNRRMLKERTKESFLRLLQDMNSGIVDPESMGADVRLRRKPFLSPKQLKVVMMTQGRHPYLLMESFAPQTAQYLGLKEALRRMTYYCDNKQWQPLPKISQSLKLGSRDKALPAIKGRLRQLGYMMASIDDVYDQKTLDAVNDIQWVLRFKPDGVISPGGMTLNYLNLSCAERLRQVRLDMDKLRWFPQTFEDRYIFINLAMSYFNLFDRTTKTSMNFKTINGRSERRSPTMKDKIVSIVVNPYWVVPPTIFREDKLEDLKNLQPWQINAYFDSHNYELWNKNFTRRIDPSSVDWWGMDPNHDYDLYIRQKPSLGNALGALKFMMTNPYAIYLHDTNQRELFAEPLRLLSSGCVRIERPVDLAEYLLMGTSWTRTVIENAMAKPGQVMKTDTNVNLKRPMPVYMMFLTSQLSSDGVLRFAEDSYGQSGRMLQRGAW